MMPKLNKRGYTLPEIVAAIVIMGIISSLAVPYFKLQLARVKTQEAIIALQSVYAAQKDYAKEHGGNYTNHIDDLDINVPPLKNFNPVNAFNGSNPTDTFSCPPSAPPKLKVAGIIRIKEPAYELSVMEDGQIICRTYPGLVCPSTAPNYTCKRLGLDDSW